MEMEELLKIVDTACTGFAQLLKPYLKALDEQLAEETSLSTKAESLIARYLQLKQHFEKRGKTFDELSSKGALEAIQNRLLVLLVAAGSDTFSTDSGTAYKSSLLQPKITDREKFLDWCLDRWDGIGGEMMQIGAPKIEAVRRYLQENGGNLPDGVETSTFTRVNVRAS